MPDQFVTQQDVEQNLSFVEKVVSYFSSDDEYKAAMLNNQKVQTEILSQMAGVSQSNHIDPTNIDVENLPVGLVGTSEMAIANGELGRAVFDISGSKFQATIRAEGRINPGDTVVINNEGNKARPSDGTTGALSIMTGSSQNDLEGQLTPGGYNVHESDELAQANDVGAVPLEPGQQKIISSTGDTEDGGLLLALGATNQENVSYTLLVDDEYHMGGTTNTPLGTVNNPFSFYDMFGTSIQFDDRVDYVASYHESGQGQVEVVSTMHTTGDR